MPEKTKNRTVVKRDVNRNTSNQIISYGLPKSKEEQYGSVRLISAATFYEKESYKKVMGVVSDELINNNGELEITEQKLNYIKYKATSAEIVSELEEFVDIFSGRYAMTDNATTPSGRTTSRGFQNRHFLNVSYISAGLLARGFEFQGYDQVPFDKTLKGPALDNGRYVITKELIESGRSLKFKFTLGAQNNHTANVSLRMRFHRRRLPLNDGAGVKTSTELVKVIAPTQYPIITTEYVLKNEDMVEFDTWEPKAFCGTGYKEFDISGEKSIFEVDLLEPENADSEIQRTQPPFTIDTWDGNPIINPNTGVLTVTKGNSTTTPTVSAGIGNDSWSDIFQPTPIVDQYGFERGYRTQKPTTVTIGNITVPDGYNNKGAKININKTIDVYRTPTYFSNLEASIKRILDTANQEAGSALTKATVAQTAYDDAVRIYNGVRRIDKKKRDNKRKDRDEAFNALGKAQSDATAAAAMLNMVKTNYGNRRKSLPFKILSTTVAGTAPVASKNITKVAAPSPPLQTIGKGFTPPSITNFGGKIICNELYRQGFLTEELWNADERYGEMMFETDPKLVIGYQMWARSVVKYMRKNPNNTKMAYWLFKSWTEYMGYKMGVVEKPTLRGRFTNWIGSQFSYAVFNLYNGKRLLDKYNYKLFKLDIDGNR
jgi:hypothetical protein